MVVEKGWRVDEMMEVVEKRIEDGEGEIEMRNEEKLEGFDLSEKG